MPLPNCRRQSLFSRRFPWPPLTYRLHSRRRGRQGGGHCGARRRMQCSTAGGPTRTSFEVTESCRPEIQSTTILDGQTTFTSSRLPRAAPILSAMASALVPLSLPLTSSIGPRHGFSWLQVLNPEGGKIYFLPRGFEDLCVRAQVGAGYRNRRCCWWPDFWCLCPTPNARSAQCLYTGPILLFPSTCFLFFFLEEEAPVGGEGFLERGEAFAAFWKPWQRPSFWSYVTLHQSTTQV